MALNTSEAYVVDNQEFWKPLLESVSDFTAILDPEGRFVFVNRTLAHLSMKDVLGARVWDFMPRDAGEKLRAAVARVFRTGVPERLETRGEGPGGRESHYDCQLGPIHRGGRVVAVTSIARDITEYKLGEARLRKSEELFQGMFASCPDAIGFANVDGLLLRVNDAFVRLTGYRREELEGRLRDRDLTPPEHHPLDAKAATQVLAGTPAVDFEKEYVRKDGARVPIQLTLYAVRGADGRPAGFSAFIRDITDRKNAERSLREREELFRLLVAGVQDYAIIMLDPQGNVVSWNEGAQRIFGRTAARAIGRSFSAFYPPQERRRVPAFLRVAVEDGRGEAEGWLLRGGASRFWANVVLTALRDDNGGLRGFASVTRDSTAVKRMEHEVLEAGAREQRRIAQDLHDSLGQKLTGIAFLSQALSQRLSDRRAGEAEDARRIADYAAQAAGEARDLSQGLLPSELGGGLSEALKALGRYAGRALGVRCEVDCGRAVEAPDELAGVHLYRIAQEAVNNAVRHGKAGLVRVGLRRDNGRLTLTIEDDGLGITPQKRRKAGLGLSIMQYRARMLGASFEIRRGAVSGTVVLCACPLPA
ncbi:MAG: PAS domain S-box protein [Elusimicrobia bacterium]|nr:PAS domain S-box protein [Elusimicrobiota bacterium]